MVLRADAAVEVTGQRSRPPKYTHTVLTAPAQNEQSRFNTLTPSALT